MKKKIGWIAVSILWILAGIQLVRNDRNVEQEKIIEVLGSVGNLIQSSVVEYEGMLLEAVENEQAFLDEIVYRCQLKKEKQESISDEYGRGTLISMKEGTLRLVTQNINGEPAQYLFLHLDFQEEPKEAFQVREKLREFLEPYLRAEQSSVNIIGSLEGELSLEQRSATADELLRKLDAEVVSEHRTMELFTIYGYTPYIAEYQLQKNQAVNVNIAMQYNEEEERTYIYAAVPVIGVEY